MINPYRSTFAEMLAVLHQQVIRDPEMDGNDLLQRANALLDQPEPKGPTDEELLDIARATDLVYYMGKGSGFASPYIEGTDIAAEVLAFARAALDHWGRPTPQPVADGEVAELVAELRHFVAGYQQMRGLDPEHVYSIHRGDAMEAHLRISRLSRIAELLEHPQPVAEGLTDEELLRVAATAIAPYEISGITPGEYEPETECCVEAYGSELIAYARAVLARWGANALPTPEATND